MDTVNVPAKFKVCIALPVSERATEFWVGVANLQSRERRGVWSWYRWKEPWWVPIGPSLTFPLSSRVSEIAAFVQQHTAFPYPFSHL